jgi:prevent-host-death family protein
VAAKRITMLDLRRRAEAIVRAVQGGQRMVLTYRGRPVLRLEPVEPAPAPSDDDFYKLPELADRRGSGLTNEQIDKILYGTPDVR